LPCPPRADFASSNALFGCAIRYTLHSNKSNKDSGLPLFTGLPLSRLLGKRPILLPAVWAIGE
jgi:hypothetical protein